MGEQVDEDVVEVAVDRLRFGLSPRDQVHDRDHVRTLAEVIPDLPPILVHAPTMRVIDGVHRVMAVRARGLSTIRASFFHGSEAEATIEAVRCNTAHGKPLTLRERETAAAWILDIHAEWSDRRIAGVCGLSPKTVAKLRIRATEDSTQLRKRLGRDGKERPINPAELRHNIAEALRSEPSASIRAIARRTGAAQGTVRDVQRRLERGEGVVKAPRSQPSLSPRLPEPRPAAVRKDDEAYLANQGGHDFVEWFEAHLVDDDAAWQPFAAAIPIGRIYEVADAARRCAGTWQRFASAIESRARRR